ncbi:MAG TPA: phosphoribosylanthranilate isomerase, partial [Thermomicrobiales bacterium]|nr:phosphoribosylanthranilate isomerase [Thermomicrobiales bacterium]
HGSETPERVKRIGELCACPTMKAIGVAARGDLAQAKAYEDAADCLLIDAKPPKDAALPGGNGRPFDWSLARDFRSPRPWLLSGGLDPETVAAAIAESGARGVDVSSGVESAPGVKDEAKVRAFVAAARRAFAHEQIAFESLRGSRRRVSSPLVGEHL